MMAVMVEPSLDFQTAIRARLIADPAVTALVQPDQIRSGSTRPDGRACVILSGAQTEYLGRASGSQHVARVYLDAHIWAVEDGPDTAKAIGWAVMQALIGFDGTFDGTDGIAVDAFDQPRVIWLRDIMPELSFVHGIMSLESVIRWRF